MKKIIILLILAVLPLSAQNKGRISLTFNDEKFDIPITNVQIFKADKINVNVRAEHKDSLSSKWVSIEMAFDDFSKEKMVSGPSEIKLQIQSDINNGLTGKRFYFNYGKEVQVEFYKNGERVSFRTPFLKFQFDKFNAEFNGSSLIINGTFWGIYSDSNESRNIKVEIKEGKFEIVL